MGAQRPKYWEKRTGEPAVKHVKLKAAGVETVTEGKFQFSRFASNRPHSFIHEVLGENCLSLSCFRTQPKASLTFSFLPSTSSEFQYARVYHIHLPPSFLQVDLVWDLFLA